MNKIFISYRREDSADVTGRICDRLRDYFGEERIFTDVDNIPLGVDFRTYLDNEVSQCKVFLAVIGKNWLSASYSNSELRLNDPADFVRVEIESALKRDIPVIPLLVGGASIPQKSQLPNSIQSLVFRNAQKIRPDPDFKNDTNRLVQSIIKHLATDLPYEVPGLRIVQRLRGKLIWISAIVAVAGVLLIWSELQPVDGGTTPTKGTPAETTTPPSLNQDTEAVVRQVSVIRKAKDALQDTLVGELSGMEFGEYYALIIGNSQYEKLPNLKTAEIDSIAVESLLREKYGFRTSLLLNANRYDILSALNNIRETLTTTDNLLIYYAGHGELDNGTGYWLPVDAEPFDDSNWIAISTITKYIETINAKQILVMTDSWTSGKQHSISQTTLERELTTSAEQRTREWFETIANARSRTVITSGGVYPTHDTVENASSHSIFAAAFLTELDSPDEPVFTSYEMFLKLEDEVRSKTARMGIDQKPQYLSIQSAGHEAGGFLFVTGDNEWRR